MRPKLNEVKNPTRPMPPLILSIEDEAYVTEVIEQTLSYAGYEVVSAATAEAAIGILQVKKPDLILLDLMLPDINGFSFFDLVLETGGPQHIPIMIVSGCVSEDAERLGFELGASDYLRKPFAPEELIERVNKVMRSVTS